MRSLGGGSPKHNETDYTSRYKYDAGKEVSHDEVLDELYNLQHHLRQGIYPRTLH